MDMLTSAPRPNGITVDKAALQKMFLTALEIPDLRASKDSLHSLSTLLRENAVATERAKADVLYMDLPEAVAARMQSCRDTYRSNCIGSALYIVGMAVKDAYIDPNMAHNGYLLGLKEIKTPTAGSLIVWRESDADHVRIKHMGVVTTGGSLETSLVSYRFGYMSRFIENRTIPDMAKTYGNNYVLLSAPWE